MTFRAFVLMVGLLLPATFAWASTEDAAKTLLAYGPGGPHRALEECAKIFREQQGIQVAVIRALPQELEEKLRDGGDIYFGGAEYMLESFHRRNPEVLDMTSAENLHPRRIGVLVRKGNPLGIRGPEDLDRDEVDILDVKLENMRHLQGSPTGRSNNIRKYEYTGQQGVSAWRSTPTLDAWVTYRSWHRTLENEADFIEIPGEEGLRYTPMALTRHTRNREEALSFIAFLKSDEARRVFEKHGWY